MSNKNIKLYLLLSLLLLYNISCNINKNLFKVISKKSSVKELFKIYHYIFEKPYDLNSEYALEKYKIFKRNLIEYEIKNKKNLGYQLGLTQFSDVSEEEFNKAYLVNESKSIVKSENNFDLNNNENIFNDNYENKDLIKNQNFSSNEKYINFNSMFDSNDNYLEDNNQNLI